MQKNSQSKGECLYEKTEYVKLINFTSFTCLNPQILQSNCKYIVNI